MCKLYPLPHSPSLDEGKISMSGENQGWVAVKLFTVSATIFSLMSALFADAMQCSVYVCGNTNLQIVMLERVGSLIEQILAKDSVTAVKTGGRIRAGKSKSLIQ